MRSLDGCRSTFFSAASARSIICRLENGADRGMLGEPERAFSLSSISLHELYSSVVSSTSLHPGRPAAIYVVLRRVVTRLNELN